MTTSTVTTNSNSAQLTPEETLAPLMPAHQVAEHQRPSTALPIDHGPSDAAKVDGGLQTIADVPSWWTHAREVLQEMHTESKPPASAVPMRVEERWDGVVSSVDSEAFEANFVARDGSSPRLHAEFSTQLIDPDDLELLVPGALFELTVGRARVYETRWIPTMRVRLRRLPALTEHDVASALESARELRAALLSREP